MRSKIEDLRMIIPFSQFKIKAETKLERSKKNYLNFNYQRG